MADIATLGIRIDTSQAKAATTDLDKLTDAGKKVEQSVDKIADAGKTAATGLKEAGNAAKGSSTSIADFAKATDRGGMSAKQYTAALRGVPAQFTDIATSLASGQAPLTVFLQQGGQLKDMFGGAGNAARALSGYMIGLLTPVNLTIAAVAGLTYAFYEGSQEQQRYQKALILSGNIAGTTSGQLQVMAQRMDDVGGTQSAAAAALTAFAASGAVGAESLEKFASSAIKFESATGTAIEDTVEKFAQLKKAPLEASIKLNESMNYLTRSVYDQIKALVEQGRATEAAKVAQDAFANTLDSRSGQIIANLGYIERGWNAVTKAVKEAGGAILSIGRSSGADSQVEALNQKLATATKNAQEARLMGNNYQAAQADEEVRRLQAQIAPLKAVADGNKEIAKAEAERAKSVADRAKFDKETEQNLSNQLKLKRALSSAENEYGSLLKRGVISQKEYNEAISGIKDKYADKSATSKAATEAAQARKAALDLDVENIRNANDRLIASYAQAESILAAKRSAGIVSETEYYAAKRDFISKNTAAQESALQAEMQRLQTEKLTGAEKIKNDQKILEVQAKLAQVRAASATNVELIAIQESAALANTKRAYQEARMAAEEYLEATARGYERTLQTFGRGDAARSQAQGRNQIEDKYSAQAQDIQNKKALDTDRSPERMATYDRQLEMIAEFRQKALKGWDEYYENLKTAESNWENGAIRSIENYLDASRNMAQQTEQLLTSAFKGAEDALVEFVKTGKLDFASLADSIISDLIRIQVRQSIAGAVDSVGGAKGVTDLIGNLLSFDGGGSTGSGARSGGIDGKGGFLSILHPQETVLDHTKGQAGTGGGVSVVQNISIDSRSDQATIISAMQEAKRQTLAAIQQSRRAGGVYA